VSPDITELASPPGLSWDGAIAGVGCARYYSGRSGAQSLPRAISLKRMLRTGAATGTFNMDCR
jgi:hypothetical protein